MEFIDRNIQQYAESFTGKEPDYLYELNRYTHSNVLKPRMLSGHLQGRFLSMISHLVQPEFVLDIGTYTGYSALCLAEGLKENGLLYTIDNNDEVLLVAEKFITIAGKQNSVKVVNGEAIESIKTLQNQVPYWNIVWMDADKADYTHYYDACIDHVKPGGIIMADNVLWSGTILDEKALTSDIDTAALHAFNQKVMEDTRVETTLLPIRDGILMIRKKT